MTDGTRQWLRHPESWMQLLTLVGAVVAFALGLGEYREEQRWRRLGLFTEQLHAFEADPAIRNALTALEYRAPRVCHAAEEAPESRCVQVTDSLLTGALVAVMQERALSDEEHRIVYGLDRLLTALDRIDYLHEEGFLGHEVQHPTVAYWVQLIGHRGASPRPAEVRRALCDYVRHFEYAGALRMVERYVPPRDRVAGCVAAPAAPQTQ